MQRDAEISAIRQLIIITLHIFHCACAKRPSFYFRSKIWRHYRVLPPNELVLTFGSFYVCVNFGYQEMRPWECAQTDRCTDADANRFYNLSHAGGDNKHRSRL